MAPAGLGWSVGWLSRAIPLLLALSAGRAPALPEVCTYCPGPAHDTSEVDHFCKQRQELKLRARCCLTKQGTIVGLDLQNCSLKELDPLFAEARSAIVLDLQANPLLNMSTSVFRNFTELQTLVLPLKIDCPGGCYAWDNITCGKDSCICHGQRSQCNSTVEPVFLLLQLCAPRMHIASLMAQASSSVFVLGASMATSVYVRVRFHSSCSLESWALPHFAYPSCSGGPSFEKSKPPEPSSLGTKNRISS
ncbi:all-trans retinoic acid-induced differentiation factor isoform X1 [Phascolarctos cinereus]|uniref:All-trans retinoic acid-induced differentiation factor isoform X2 n=1 Tax=Phascolarctos cinereus TaxID=38626 RepID=A0A6P5K2N7_PHACI|nr:all-trans retinoic acid-induced differentiation factor isoform X2 [Phascolarctos cinereus]